MQDRHAGSAIGVKGQSTKSLKISSIRDCPGAVSNHQVHPDCDRRHRALGLYQRQKPLPVRRRAYTNARLTPAASEVVRRADPRSPAPSPKALVAAHEQGHRPPGPEASNVMVRCGTSSARGGVQAIWSSIVDGLRKAGLDVSARIASVSEFAQIDCGFDSCSRSRLRPTTNTDGAGQ